MESFKIIEKETKTKAFSKQGLEAARERRDPKEQARDEAREWLNNSVDELQTQIEAFEAEIEALAETKKSKSKSTRPPRLGHLEESMSRHHQHIQRMELVLRLVDNEALQPEDVSDLKELVEDYIDRNQDDFDEFTDPEDMYADLELDDLAEAVAGGEVSHDVGKPAVLQKKLEEEGSAGEDSSAGGALGGAKALARGNSNSDSSSSLVKEALNGKRKDGSSVASDVAKPASPAAPNLGSGGKKIPAPLGLSKPLASLGLQSGGPVPGPKGREGQLGGNGGSWGAPGGGNGGGANFPAGGAGQPPPGGAGGLQQQQSWGFGSGGDPPVFGNSPTSQGGTQGGTQGGQTSGAGVKFPLPKPAPGSPLLGGGAQNNAGGTSPAKNLPAPKFGVDAAKAGGANAAQAQAQAQAQLAPGDPKPADAEDSLTLDLPGMVLLADLADPSKHLPLAVRLGGMTHEDPGVNVRLLESAYRNLPTPEDGTWTRRRVEPPAKPPPPSYPSSTPPVLDNPALFERLDADALFFAFYHQQGTARQYLAARELKRANWRFHKKYATWFARQEDPKVSTEEYEQGSYIYFDFNMSADGGWCQRSKGDFLFEYSQLESEMN